MERIVFCASLICVLLSRAHARVALTDVSQNIDQELTDSLQQTTPKIIYLNNTGDLDALTNVIINELNLNHTTPRKCSQNNNDIRENEIDSNVLESCEPEIKIDNGTALILTPYLEEGRISEGRKASEVDPNIFLGVKSYSGFFTVNKTYDSNIFFWYFPVENKPVNSTPWIIWLQGGPGASSMAGLFNEMGPFIATPKGRIVRNPYTWTRNHSVVFVESPVGTGYSFTNSEHGYAKDMATYSEHLYSTLEQFLQLFPELRTAPLFLAGESYAGKFVPALGMAIHSHIQSGTIDLNFKGLMIGNGYIEPDMLPRLPTSFYNIGLLTAEQMEIVRPLTESFQRDISANRSREAQRKWLSLVTSVVALSGVQTTYNFVDDESIFQQTYYPVLLQRTDVKRAIHVGDIRHSTVNVTVHTELAPDFITSSRQMLETLLNHYQVLMYCGQLDLMLSCAVSGEFIRKWRWDHYEEFKNATRYPFGYKNKVGGYIKTGGHLTEALIRGAGHSAPQNAPGAALRLVSRWTRDASAGLFPATRHFDRVLSHVRQEVSDALRDDKI